MKNIAAVMVFIAQCTNAVPAIASLRSAKIDCHGVLKAEHVFTATRPILWAGAEDYSMAGMLSRVADDTPYVGQVEIVDRGRTYRANAEYTWAIEQLIVEEAPTLFSPHRRMIVSISNKVTPHRTGHWHEASTSRTEDGRVFLRTMKCLVTLS